jgi:hypothetical protein
MQSAAILGRALILFLDLFMPQLNEFLWWFHGVSSEACKRGSAPHHLFWRGCLALGLCVRLRFNILCKCDKYLGRLLLRKHVRRCCCLRQHLLIWHHTDRYSCRALIRLLWHWWILAATSALFICWCRISLAALFNYLLCATLDLVWLALIDHNRRIIQGSPSGIVIWYLVRQGKLVICLRASFKLFP